MIFFVANDGTIIKGLPSPVYQGAANSNTITVIAPFASNTAATVAFQLPNGTWASPAAMAAQNALQGIVNEETGQTYAGWTYDIPNEITTYYGTVTVQFFFYSAQAGVVTATSSTSFQVGRGVPAVLPETPSEDIYGQILSNFASIQTQLNNGSFTARSIYAWNPSYTYGANEITFYPEIGEYGAFVQSIQTGNTNHVPYVDGAIDSAWWKEVVNFNNITAEYLGELNEILSEAQTAQRAAETAQRAAETAETNAQASEDAAAAAQSAAETAESNAKASENAAAVSKYNADVSAINAKIAENNAKDSANRAQELVDGIGAVYKPVGSIAFAQLPAVLTESERGYVYNITDDFVTDSRFVEGAGKSYSAGSNVAVILNDAEYKYDILSGIVDLSNYAKTDGTYPNMTVGNAIKSTQDGDGLNISQNYVKSVAQDLTAVQQEQARGNIGAGVPRNLFYNGDFRLNTLGQSEYVDDGSTYVPCIDGWEFGYGDCTLEVLESGGVKITKETGEVNPTNFQSKDIKDVIAHAGSYTVSFGVDALASIQQGFIFYVTKEGKTVYVSTTAKNDTENNIAIRTFTLTEEQVSAIRQSTRLVIGIQKLATVESMTIYGAKLEEGKKSTYPNGITNNATKAQYAEKAASAMQDGDGNNIVETYAKQSGEYPNMTVGGLSYSKFGSTSTEEYTDSYVEICNVAFKTNWGNASIILLVNGYMPYTTQRSGIIEIDVRAASNVWTVKLAKVLSGNLEADRLSIYSDENNVIHVYLHVQKEVFAITKLSALYDGVNITYPNTVISTLPDGVILGNNVNIARYDSNGNVIADTYAKKAGLSNPNLLINPDFSINQRGETSYTGAGTYTADRWKLINANSFATQTDGKWTFGISGVTTALSRTAIAQDIENFEKLKGKTVTASIKVNAITEDVSRSTSLTIHDGVESSYISITGAGVFTVTKTINANATMVRVYIASGSNSINYSVTPEWIKLEIGSTATEFVSPDPATELLKCQRYYQRISLAGATGAATQANILNVSAPLATSMRQIPSSNIIINPVFYGNSSSYNFTSATVVGLYNNSILLGFLLSSSLTLQNVYTASNGLVGLDAEI